MLKKLLVTVLFFFAAATLHAKTEYVYLSAGGHVTVFTLDEKSGELTEIQKLPVERNGVMAFASDGKYAYVAQRIKKKTMVATFAIAEDGKLKQLHVAEAGGYPSYLVLDSTNRYLYGSQYREGTVTALSLDERIYKNEKKDDMRVYALEKKAHMTQFSPDGQFLFVPATEPNKVFQLVMNKDGGLAPNEKPYAAGPTKTSAAGAMQPRHIRFHPKLNVAYTTLERELPGVGVWDYDPKNGQLTFRNGQVSLPRGFEGWITTAELHLSPDAKFLYISNRDGTKDATKFQDSIVIYKVDEKTGDVSFVDHFACGRIPRAFWMSQSGKYMFITGQRDHQMIIARRDEKTGLLSRLKTIETGKGPIWVESITK